MCFLYSLDMKLSANKQKPLSLTRSIPHIRYWHISNASLPLSCLSRLKIQSGKVKYI